MPLTFNSTQPAHSSGWLWMTKHPELFTKKKLKAYKLHSLCVFPLCLECWIPCVPNSGFECVCLHTDHSHKKGKQLRRQTVSYSPLYSSDQQSIGK